MSSRAWVKLAGFGLALAMVGIALNAGHSAGDDEDEAKATKEAQQAVLQLIETMRKGSDGKDQIQAIHSKFGDLKVVMNIFKPSSKGGLGVGAKGPGDGIEQRIISWSKKRKMSAGDVKTNQQAMERAAEVSRAMAEVADVYPPSKDAAKWKQYVEEMRKGSTELMEAARRVDAAGVPKAAMNLNGSCTGCHSVFRDN